VKEELLETLHAGPGAAARREVMVGTSGPVPSRGTLRTVRVSVEWLTGYSLSGVWRVLQACGLGWHAAHARLFSPDPDYRSKVRRLPVVSRYWWKRQKASSSSELAQRKLALAGRRVKEDDAYGKG
jgi:hypothetical protein